MTLGIVDEKGGVYLASNNIDYVTKELELMNLPGENIDRTARVIGNYAEFLLLTSGTTNDSNAPETQNRNFNLINSLYSYLLLIMRTQNAGIIDEDYVRFLDHESDVCGFNIYVDNKNVDTEGGVLVYGVNHNQGFFMYSPAPDYGENPVIYLGHLENIIELKNIFFKSTSSEEVIELIHNSSKKINSVVKLTPNEEADFSFEITYLNEI